MALRILKDHELLHYEISSQIKEEVSQRKSPSRPVECEPVELGEVHNVQKTTAKDYNWVPLLFILEVIIHGLSPLECAIVNTSGTVIF